MQEQPPWEVVAGATWPHVHLYSWAGCWVQSLMGQVDSGPSSPPLSG